jgi:hypothetical protein
MDEHASGLPLRREWQTQDSKEPDDHGAPALRLGGQCIMTQ